MQEGDDTYVEAPVYGNLAAAVAATKRATIAAATLGAGAPASGVIGDIAPGGDAVAVEPQAGVVPIESETQALAIPKAIVTRGGGGGARARVPRGTHANKSLATRAIAPSRATLASGTSNPTTALDVGAIGRQDIGAVGMMYEGAAPTILAARGKAAHIGSKSPLQG